MRYQRLAQIIQAGCWLLCLIILPGCIATPSTDAPPSLSCPVAPIPAPAPASQEQAPNNNNNQSQTTMTAALQQRLQRTIAAQTKQIEVLSSQLEALRQIDQETRRQPRKRLIYPIP
jgi:hypothetical protein